MHEEDIPLDNLLHGSWPHVPVSVLNHSSHPERHHISSIHSELHVGHHCSVSGVQCHDSKTKSGQKCTRQDNGMLGPSANANADNYLHLMLFAAQQNCHCQATHKWCFLPTCSMNPVTTQIDSGFISCNICKSMGVWEFANVARYETAIYLFGWWRRIHGTRGQEAAFMCGLSMAILLSRKEHEAIQTCARKKLHVCVAWKLQFS